MYHRVLAPLDGSPLSEKALPLAAGLARRLGAALELITVLDGRFEGGEKPPAETVEAARAYLRGVKAGLSPAVSAVGVAVAAGDAASEIANAVKRGGSDLIVMASRGRSGIVRGLLGSVADRVVRVARVPVLVVRSETAPRDVDDARVERVIVPLDGSRLAEAALPHADALARAFEAEIMLLRAVRFPVAYAGDAFAGAYASEVLTARELEEEAQAYLDSVATRLRDADGAPPVRTRVGVGSPRAQVIAAAEEQPNSMVAMTTRGTSGLTRWVLGSVADGIMRTAPVPVLVMRPGEPQGRVTA